MLPKYVDIMEWVAVNSLSSSSPEQEQQRLILMICILCPVYDFYNNLNEFYGTIAERCTPQACPTMSAGSRCATAPRSSSIADLLIQITLV
jgi:hypothetical protein